MDPKAYLTLALLLIGQVVPAADQPNVVLILIDDLNHYGLSCYGAQAVESTQGEFERTAYQTPHIDRLAEGGLRCEQAFVYPICEPTRVAMLTGMHNGRNFVYPKALHESQITISDVFKRAGYATGMYGKWKQTRGTPRTPGKNYISQFGWDDYCCFDVVAEGSRYLDPSLVINGEVVNHTKRDKDPRTGRRWYGPDICNRAALEFIEDHQNEPFFLYYPLILVHDRHTPTPDTVPESAYDNFDLKADLGPSPRPGDDRQYFPDMLKYMDKMVGKVIEKLDALELREDTLVVVMGDNGGKISFRFMLEDGRALIGRKGHNRDGGEHVGLISNRPGTVPASPAGGQATYDGLFDVVDMYPTLLDACGIELPNPDSIDGVSAWSQVTGSTAKPHRSALYKWSNDNRPMTDLANVVTFAQTPCFKRYAPHGAFSDGRFFDLRTDRDEEAGERVTHLRWDNYHYSGLDPSKLTPEQQAAYDDLGKVLEENAYRPVKKAKIIAASQTLRVGERIDLSYELTPANATRNNVIWESSDPQIASINKFGELTAHRPGKVAVRLYSWDDALPVAKGAQFPAYDKDKVRDSIEITIE